MDKTLQVSCSNFVGVVCCCSNLLGAFVVAATLWVLFAGATSWVLCFVHTEENKSEKVPQTVLQFCSNWRPK
jgi:hypothetical protein